MVVKLVVFICFVSVDFSTVFRFSFFQSKRDSMTDEARSGKFKIAKNCYLNNPDSPNEVGKKDNLLPCNDWMPQFLLERT